MTLRANLRVTRETFALDLDLTIEPGEVVALLGPNGAGKTTALRALAGLLASDSTIRLGESTWDGLPTELRPIGVVFQDHLLFATMTALDNVAFGLRARGLRKSEANTRAAHWLAKVGLTGHAAAKPRTLSGGQAQRVALARALATDPDLLLLDEPLAALDASTRLRVRAELGRHLRDYPGHTLLVTHDPLDAMVLADRLVILEHGRVVQQGSPRAVVRQPRTDYVAHLVGLNFYRGTAHDTEIHLDEGGTLTVAEPATGPVHVVFPPSAVSLYPAKPVGSPRNTWQATVAGIEQHAHTTRIELDGTPAVLADITTATVADLRLHPGDTLWASVKATEIHTYPR
ncbi:ABC transporter ATP-binding protein [Crossiella sp. CA-258035]|uniref:ABC transporter ATP-binding protein n=1 Tax=Crossiella sp. CA-258035 TaxID=2981138 RepID=UPI0024BC54E2|nr:ABC transporter ATP-binding protein [Crossiella sp. CA-258035]WHT16272.1 ABC transporter ATP-binding protein [Crossiella sp. CA-258035]